MTDRDAPQLDHERLRWAEALLALEDLSDWDRGFVTALMLTLRADRRLAQGQADSLEELCRQYGIARGLTASEEELWG